MSQLLRQLSTGAAAGLAATVPMSALMHVGHGSLPRGQRQPLPPAKITHELLEAVQADDLTSQSETALTLANHFAYGTAAGAVYGALVYGALVGGRRAAPVVAGVSYGLGVWAASYLVGLPAAGLHRSALREPLGRNVLMLAAHVVWGASLGTLVSLANRRTST